MARQEQEARFVILCLLISSSPFVFSSGICNGFFFLSIYSYFFLDQSMFELP